MFNRQDKNYSLTNGEGNLVITNLKLADNFFLRFKGLMGTKELKKNDGLLITNCKQVHTHFMRYALDIVFLDKNYQVIEIINNLKPWKFTKYFKLAYYVIELPANTASPRIKQSDQLKVTPND